MLSMIHSPVEERAPVLSLVSLVHQLEGVVDLGSEFLFRQVQIRFAVAFGGPLPCFPLR